ncbi:AraC family transcriptional regulator [Acuticoccus mangrovi]|uniref:Helix-turn-helix domain-containing protein n=1 Tax=Acuticoccus mangrovi TaxID=2796142 RepID=A0A934IPV1_9HYPH|nr:AraC family transcriptional regulator [Acuticoccus mangrovi]MBJ3775845.1 helix-turn-helix domain-containing protein [Acuticoccus mangrovi]
MTPLTPGAPEWRAPFLAERATTYATHSVGDARAYVSTLFRPHRLTARDDGRSIAFSHQMLASPRMTLNAMAYGEAVDVHSRELEDFFLLELTFAGSCEIDYGHSGIVGTPGTMFVLDANRPFIKRWSDDCDQIIVKIAKADVQRCLGSVASGHLAPLAFDATAVPMTRCGGAVAAMVSTLARLGATEAGAASRLVTRASEEQLILAMLGTFPHSCTEALEAPGGSIAPASVVRARRFMMERIGEPVTLAEIVAASGVGPRALQRAFGSVHGCSPLTWLREARLALARRRLEQAGEGASVTEIALASGFGHLSRFAELYRQRYAERPSDTLRKAASTQ